ncbi:MAG: 30S ribosomal protein S8 [Mariprofundales bacterium]
MMMTDRIADLLTRVRNAQMARLERIELPASRMLIDVARILRDEGYIESARAFNQKGRRRLRLTLRYEADGKAVIREIQRVSRPGRRVYCNSTSLPRVRNGFGTAIVSTSKGVMTDKKARSANVGGEVLCTVF